MRSGLQGVPSLHSWLKSNLTAGMSVGIDATLHSTSSTKLLQTDLASVGVSLTIIGIFKNHLLFIIIIIYYFVSLCFLVSDENLVDIVWGSDRPAPVINPIRSHLLCYSGQTAESKITSMQSKLQETNSEFTVVSMLDEVLILLHYFFILIFKITNLIKLDCLVIKYSWFRY